MNAPQPFAAIDLGTNTALMVVGKRAADGSLQILDDLCETARLGEGLGREGDLLPEARARTIEILGRFMDRAMELHVPRTNLRAVSTAVLRRAENRDDFLEEVRERLSLEMDILSGEEEARLAHRAAAGADEKTIVIDVGGGSTEAVWDAGRSRASVALGAVVLTERYLADGGPSESGWVALLREVQQAFEAFPKNAAEGLPVVCLGGTSTNWACLELRLSAFDHEPAEGFSPDPATALRWGGRLAALPLEQRIAEHPIEADRASILPAGLACVGLALERLGASRVRVSGRGLRYGLLAEMLALR